MHEPKKELEPFRKLKTLHVCGRLQGSFSCSCCFKANEMGPAFFDDGKKPVGLGIQVELLSNFSPPFRLLWQRRSLSSFTACSAAPRGLSLPLSSYLGHIFHSSRSAMTASLPPTADAQPSSLTHKNYDRHLAYTCRTSSMGCRAGLKNSAYHSRCRGNIGLPLYYAL